jgi:hypothetical protein
MSANQPGFIYTSVILLLYSYDLGDIQMIEAAKESLKLALTEHVQ